MVNRYSSRRDKLFLSLLASKLDKAQGYDRIAGYFSSSILEIAGEEIENMSGKVRIICNSDLDPDDVKTAKLSASSLRREWCDFAPEEIPGPRQRFERLYNFLTSGKLEVRVLPKKSFGLAHGKAGVITMADGSKTTFLGSVNESYNGWKVNYELVWEDNSPDAIEWVQAEFDALWNDPSAVALSDFIISDIKRISQRQELETIDRWKETDEGDPASVAVESPIFRKGFGLWDHQKYFVEKAFEDHKKPYGARYVLADQVGLGKTVQLAMAGLLMALYGQKPILVIVPKTLMAQWQTELSDLLGIPSAIWKSNRWVDENDVSYPLAITKCPRRIGIISQGIISNGSDSCKAIQEDLLSMTYECVIADEAHRARRRNLGENKINRAPEMNNLYKFLYHISPKTHSMLLATATPVQLHPIEAFDLLNILASTKNISVLGSPANKWRARGNIKKSLEVVTGQSTVTDDIEYWEWVKNPMPPTDESPVDIGRIRSVLNMHDNEFVTSIPLSDLTGIARSKFENLMADDFLRFHNPYIRHIIRRDRSIIDNEKIKVTLVGDNDQDSIPLHSYLADAYQLAEDFCQSIKKRSRASGFLKTLLLKRIGSSMAAGLSTGRKMLNEWNIDESDIEEDNDEDVIDDRGVRELKDLTAQETSILKSFVMTLETAIGEDDRLDPKLDQVCEILEHGVIDPDEGKRTKPWIDLGCIVFSQYFDTADWAAKNLSLTFPGRQIGIYAGGDKSGYYMDGIKHRSSRDHIKGMVKSRELKVLVGTDAASEGLNLQSLSTLINIDLPWNPTRLEQRKGRIYRIGQANDVVYIYNMRYKNSVEDRVHSLLSDRLANIYGMFGQIPDVLEDAWVAVAENNIEEARKIIDAVPEQHPFEIKYQTQLSASDWESCVNVLNYKSVARHLVTGW